MNTIITGIEINVAPAKIIPYSILYKFERLAKPIGTVIISGVLSTIKGHKISFHEARKTSNERTAIAPFDRGSPIL